MGGHTVLRYPRKSFWEVVGRIEVKVSGKREEKRRRVGGGE